MKFNFEETKIYVRPGATDLRKGVGGLLAVIENEMIRDERLSYNARGILATIISYLDEWNSSFLLEYLTKNSPDNELSIEDGLNELKNLGYL